MDNLKLIKMSGVRSETVKMLWNPYIPLGKITILQGDPSCGKTTVALAIAAAVTRGENIAEGGDNSGFPPSNVIFQTAEDGLADTVKPRLEQFGADCDRVLVIDESDKALSLADERIEAAIVSVGAVLAVIDPVQAYCNGSDFHSVNGMRPLMKHLAGVAERTGAAILIIGHLNKKGGKSAYRGLGSIDIYAAARSVLTVGKLPFDDTMRGLVHSKANLTPAGKSLAFGFDERSGFTWLGEHDVTLDELLDEKPRKESQLAKARKLIKTKLACGEAPAMEIMEAAEEQGISQKTLNRAKTGLGVISVKRGTGWYWQLPIDADYVVYDCDDSQDGQDSNVTALTIFTGTEG
jgi:hypothetical protein